MLDAFLLLSCCLADCEPIRDFDRGAYTAGLVNMSFLCCIGVVLALRRRRLIQG